MRPARYGYRYAQAGCPTHRVPMVSTYTYAVRSPRVRTPILLFLPCVSSPQQQPPSRLPLRASEAAADRNKSTESMQSYFLLTSNGICVRSLEVPVASDRAWVSRGPSWLQAYTLKESNTPHQSSRSRTRSRRASKSACRELAAALKSKIHFQNRAKKKAAGPRVARHMHMHLTRRHQTKRVWTLHPVTRPSVHVCDGPIPIARTPRVG